MLSTFTALGDAPFYCTACYSCSMQRSNVLQKICYAIMQDETELAKILPDNVNAERKGDAKTTTKKPPDKVNMTQVLHRRR